uniref:DNA N 6 adenine methyltransferase n=1 Tax=Dulem virus 40 TaxID=3145758 RepID=A0AAU8AUL2_9CAUD
MNTSFQRTESSDEWYSPNYIVTALGTFDLDPCTPSKEFYTAKECFTKEDDGLAKPWFGRVWLNPPYSRRLIAPFIKKMAQHGNGVALIFNRMDIALWHDVIFPTATAMLILKGRLKFYRPDGSRGDSAGCGSVLVAWGWDNSMALRNCGLDGKFIKLNK